MELFGYNVKYISELKCIRWSTSFDASISYFKESVEVAADMYLELSSKDPDLKVLIDLTNLGELLQRDVEWACNNALKDMFLESGVRHIAIVKPHSKNSLRHFAMLFENVSQIHNVEVFDSEELALDWLGSESEKMQIGRYELYQQK